MRSPAALSALIDPMETEQKRMPAIHSVFYGFRIW